MPNIKQRLDQIIPKIQSEAFIQNKGLGNEIGFYIFDYDPADELLVRDYVEHIKKEFNHAGSNRRIIEYDLFEILLDIARDKKIFDQIAQMEEKKGRDKLFEALAQIGSPSAYIAKMAYEQKPGDLVFITGVGKVYPFMRSHNILNNLFHVLDRIPVIMFFPGTYDGQALKLFNRFNDDNYYRAFQLIK
jgi:hypothetical protein